MKLKVRFVEETDGCFDLSDIGKYDDKPEPWVIVRRDDEYLSKLEEDEEWQMPEFGGECRFFVPYAGGEAPGTEDYQKNGKQDYERMESYERGNWRMLYCYAEAEVVIGGVCQKLRSGGCGGIPNDDDHSDIRDDELAELKNVLIAAGFGKQVCAKACDTSNVGLVVS